MPQAVHEGSSRLCSVFRSVPFAQPWAHSHRPAQHVHCPMGTATNICTRSAGTAAISTHAPRSAGCANSKKRTFVKFTPDGQSIALFSPYVTPLSLVFWNIEQSIKSKTAPANRRGTQVCDWRCVQCHSCAWNVLVPLPSPALRESDFPRGKVGQRRLPRCRFGEGAQFTHWPSLQTLKCFFGVSWRPYLSRGSCKCVFSFVLWPFLQSAGVRSVPRSLSGSPHTAQSLGASAAAAAAAGAEV